MCHRLPVLLLFFLPLLGCSSDGLNRGGSLSGRVLLDDKPVLGGQVEIYSSDGAHCVACEIKPNGDYLLVEPPLGECRIVVKTSHLKGMRVAGAKAGAAKEGGSAGMVMPKGVGLGYVAIPAKYEALASTDLHVKVEKGLQKHDIALTAK